MYFFVRKRLELVVLWRKMRFEGEKRAIWGDCWLWRMKKTTAVGTSCGCWDDDFSESKE